MTATLRRRPHAARPGRRQRPARLPLPPPDRRRALTIGLGGTLVARRRRSAWRPAARPRSAAARPAAALLCADGRLAIANSRPQDDFFRAYATARALQFQRRPRQPAAGHPAAAQGRRPLHRARAHRRSFRAGPTAPSRTTPTRRRPRTPRATARRATTTSPSSSASCPSSRPSSRSSRSSGGRASASSTPPRTSSASASASSQERGLRQALRDLHRPERRHEQGPPGLRAHLHRLARRAGAEELRVRARRRRPLPGRQGPARERRASSTACAPRPASWRSASSARPARAAAQRPPAPDAGCS